MRIRWTRGALADLVNIGEFIEQQNAGAARRVLQSIYGQVESLKNQPLVGRPGRIEGTRELIHRRYPYIVAYRVLDSDVEILAVRHTARRWPERLE